MATVDRFLLDSHIESDFFGAIVEKSSMTAGLERQRIDSLLISSAVNFGKRSIILEPEGVGKVGEVLEAWSVILSTDKTLAEFVTARNGLIVLLASSDGNRGIAINGSAELVTLERDNFDKLQIKDTWKFAGSGFWARTSINLFDIPQEQRAEYPDFLEFLTNSDYPAILNLVMDIEKNVKRAVEYSIRALLDVNEFRTKLKEHQ